MGEKTLLFLCLFVSKLRSFSCAIFDERCQHLDNTTCDLIVDDEGSEQIRHCKQPSLNYIPLCCPKNKVAYPECAEINDTFEIPIYENNIPLEGYKIKTRYVKHNHHNSFRISNFKLDTNGSLRTMTTGKSMIYMPQHYCVTFMKAPDEVEGNKYKLVAYVCFPHVIIDFLESHSASVLSNVLLYSLPFLVATLLVYVILPELHNLHGYIMITYLSCLSLHYAAVSVYQAILRLCFISYIWCLSIDYAGIFCGIASFFWLNIFCFDIWWTFSGQRYLQRLSRGGIKKRYVFYSIYAWLLPVILTSALGYAWYKYNIYYDIYPCYGMMQTKYYENTRGFEYLYVPFGISLVSNIIMFAATACRIFKIRKETRILEENHSNRKILKKEGQRFFLYIKLFSMMASKGLMQIIICLSQRYNAYRVADIINTFISVCIFIIFVLNKKVLKLLVKRYMPWLAKMILRRENTRGQLTSTECSATMNSTNMQGGSSNTTINTEVSQATQL